MIPEHLRSMVEAIREAPIQPPPHPWREAAVHGVGGLTSVGFARDTDMLLVVSPQGRGVFDCTSGSLLDRDRDSDGDYEDEIALEARGIGALEGTVIRMSGLHGGGLPRWTHDGWSAEQLALDWPRQTLLLLSPWSSIYDLTRGKSVDFTKLAVDSEVRAYGFSPTGCSIVVATSSDLMIYTR
ncbi:MAG TPA: hypothetical protein VMY37_05015 [Thermoguttaceae bacterium]|nr:hypothetical protein [Thermoguttaceae bacterium]